MIKELFDAQKQQKMAMTASTATEAQLALADALQAINNCLDKIEKQDTKKSAQQTYTGAAIIIGQKKCVDLRDASKLSYEAETTDVQQQFLVISTPSSANSNNAFQVQDFFENVALQLFDFSLTVNHLSQNDPEFYNAETSVFPNLSVVFEMQLPLLFFKNFQQSLRIIHFFSKV